MNLTLPSPQLTATSTWASNINTAITSIDSHSHVSGQGQRLTPSGININANLSLNSYSFTYLKELSFISSAAGTNNSLYSTSGDLYFTDGSSNDVQVTLGGKINISAFGGIDGDYSSTTAAIIYVDSTKTYSLYDSNAALAAVLCKAVVNTTLSATTIDVGTTLTANSTGSLQAVSATSTVTASGDVGFTGNTSGRGIVPVGAVIGLASNLAGVSLPTSFLELNGQTISDATSPMNGVTLPNVSNSNFLMGSTTAGTAGGAATYVLTEANMYGHTHVIDNSHANTFALGSATVPSSTHTHGIAHTHMHTNRVLYSLFGVTYLIDISLTSSDSSSISSGTSWNFFNGYLLHTPNDADPSGNDNLRRTISNIPQYTTGVLSPPTGTDGTDAASDVPSATQTITISGNITDYSGSSGAIGSGTAISLLPSYITTKYAIRYK